MDQSSEESVIIQFSNKRLKQKAFNFIRASKNMRIEHSKNIHVVLSPSLQRVFFTRGEVLGTCNREGEERERHLYGLSAARQSLPTGFSVGGVSMQPRTQALYSAPTGVHAVLNVIMNMSTSPVILKLRHIFVLSSFRSIIAWKINRGIIIFCSKLYKLYWKHCR